MSYPLRTVVEQRSFRDDAATAGLDEEQVREIVATIAADPMAGDLLAGTGGAYKMRFRAKGKGKRGGVRVVYYYAGETLPVFLLTVFAKGDKVNLSKAERNAIRKLGEKLKEYGS